MITENLMARKLAVLGHPVRLAVIRLLVRAGPRGLAAGYLGKQLKTAPNVLTFHLQKLVHGGLVTSKREGQFIIYKAVLSDLLELVDNLVSTCCADASEKCGPACPSTESAPPATFIPKAVPDKEES